MSWPLNRQGIVILGLSLCTLLPPSPQTKSRGRGEGGALHRSLPQTNPAGMDQHTARDIRGPSPPRHSDQPTKCRIHCHTTRRGLSLTETPSTPIQINIYIFKKNRILFYTNFKRVNKRIHWFRVHRRPISVKKNNNNNIRYAVSNCPDSCGLCLNYLRHI